MSNIKAVLWDLGGVLCRFRPDRRLAEFSRLSGQPTTRVEEILTQELRRDLDLGRVVPRQLHELVRVGLEWNCDYETLRRAWVVAFEPDDRVLAIARQVPVRNGLLTNNGPPLADSFGQSLPAVAAVIHTPVFSADIGLEKPDPQTFLIACTRLDCKPGQVLFIDDNPSNVSGARGAGLNAVQYQTPDELGTMLRNDGVLEH